MIKIEAPTHCPTCSSQLEWVNHLLYCRNPICDSKMQKKLEHFAKTLKIKGLGPSAIEKLGLEDFNDVYALSVDDMAEQLGSQKIAEKLHSEIENSRGAPLNAVLPAFSIPLIGKSATEKLSTVCKNISDIDRDSCQRAGLGPKATDNLLSWLEDNFYYYESLPFNFEFSGKDSIASNNGVVCISGKLKSFKTKAEATKALNDAGYEVKSSLTKQVTILVNESGVESSKTKQARDSGVTIITDLKNFLEN